MRYALIREMDISNGNGIGVSLFVQGCERHCPGCFNPETWDRHGGYEWTQDIEDKFIDLLHRPFITRVSFLGGEPLADYNISDVAKLYLRIMDECPNIQIWLYTGYTFEDIASKKDCSKSDVLRNAIVSCTDILVDGPFDKSRMDLNYPWAGSTNQRVIDVHASIKANMQPILYMKD